MAYPAPIALHGAGVPSKKAWVLAGVLFILTFLSTTYAGMFYATGSADILFMVALVLTHPSALLLGLPFSFTFMAILLAHEMGHFLACRHYDIRCTPPFFIPLPISLVGTLGAFIRIQSPFQNRKALFDVGVSGPLAGFAFVLPSLVIGISASELVPRGNLQGALSFGEPLLFRFLGNVLVGYTPATHDMIAHPIAIAAWFGLLVTALNLLPIWQLDGGHIAYAMLGRMGQRRVSILATCLLVLVSFLGWPFPAYLLFSVLLLIFGARFRFYHPPTLFDHEDLGKRRVILGLLAFALLILCFTPVPFYFS